MTTQQVKKFKIRFPPPLKRTRRFQRKKTLPRFDLSVTKARRFFHACTLMASDDHHDFGGSGAASHSHHHDASSHGSKQQREESLFSDGNDSFAYSFSKEETDKRNLFNLQAIVGFAGGWHLTGQYNESMSFQERVGILHNKLGLNVFFTWGVIDHNRANRLAIIAGRYVARGRGIT